MWAYFLWTDKVSNAPRVTPPTPVREANRSTVGGMLASEVSLARAWGLHPREDVERQPRREQQHGDHGGEAGRPLYPPAHVLTHAPAHRRSSARPAMIAV